MKTVLKIVSGIVELANEQIETTAKNAIRLAVAPLLAEIEALKKINWPMKITTHTIAAVFGGFIKGLIK